MTKVCVSEYLYVKRTGWVQDLLIATIAQSMMKDLVSFSKGDIGIANDMNDGNRFTV